jgi:hypothetical protein
MTSAAESIVNQLTNYVTQPSNTTHSVNTKLYHVAVMVYTGNGKRAGGGGEAATETKHIAKRTQGTLRPILEQRRYPPPSFAFIHLHYCIYYYSDPQTHTGS